MTSSWQIPILDGEFTDYQDLEDIYNTLMAMVCVTCAGLAAGLTMGLLSLDMTKLEIKAMIGTSAEKAAAISVMPIVRRHHLLLVTLLLFNSLANESLPIFLGSLVPNYLAIIISVILILLFGEILPSALFTGSEQLVIAAKFVPLVTFLMTMFWPVAYPISKVLDYFFGEDAANSTMSRGELEALVLLQHPDYGTGGMKAVQLDFPSSSTSSKRSNDSSKHKFLLQNEPSPAISVHVDVGASALDVENISLLPLNSKRSDEEDIDVIESKEGGQGRNSNDSHFLRHQEAIVEVRSGNISSSSNDNGDCKDGGGLSEDMLTRSEIRILTGVLKLSRQQVRDAMIPLASAFMLSDTTPLDRGNLEQILASGFSRLPVFAGQERQRILGYILVKSLVVMGNKTSPLVGDQPIHEPLFLRPNMGLLDALNTFRGARSHIAIVCSDPEIAMQCVQRGRTFSTSEGDGRVRRSSFVPIVEPGLRHPSHEQEQIHQEQATILGIVTLEDVLERLIQDKIEDETDRNWAYPVGRGYGRGGETAAGSGGVMPLFNSIRMHK